VGIERIELQVGRRTRNKMLLSTWNEKQDLGKRFMLKIKYSEKYKSQNSRQSGFCYFLVSLVFNSFVQKSSTAWKEIVIKTYSGWICLNHPEVDSWFILDSPSASFPIFLSVIGLHFTWDPKVRDRAVGTRRAGQCLCPCGGLLFAVLLGLWPHILSITSKSLRNGDSPFLQHCLGLL
jgi:hypothetical protein